MYVYLTSASHSVCGQNFVPRIETSVKEAIDKHLASKQIVQHVSEAVEKGVRQPIMETFRSQFSEVLAPSFELALQKLFEQINNTFENGIRGASLLFHCTPSSH